MLHHMLALGQSADKHLHSFTMSTCLSVFVYYVTYALHMLNRSFGKALGYSFMLHSASVHSAKVCILLNEVIRFDPRAR